MNCPICDSSKTKVTRTVSSKSKPDLNFTTIYRTRKCRKCDHQFVTLEITQPPKEIIVVKKNNKTSTFSYEKLFASIKSACENLRIPFEEQRVVFTSVMRDIVRYVETENKTRIMSHEIGAIVLKSLKSVNRIAWLRYLSHFDDDEENIKKSIRQWMAEETDSIE